MFPEEKKKNREIFRNFLKAFSYPGRIFSLGIDKESELYIWETLLDNEVSFCMIGYDTAEEKIDRIYKQTKSKYVRIDEADYVIIIGGSSNGYLSLAKKGTLEFPELSATVFYFVKNLASSNGLEMIMKGPGIIDEISLKIDGIDREDLITLKEINSDFPLGIDLIFIDENYQISGLPRSIQFALKE